MLRRTSFVPLPRSAPSSRMHQTSGLASKTDHKPLIRIKIMA
jgi:hypothetical protein